MTIMNKNTKKHQKSFRVFVLGLALVCASLVSVLNTRPILADTPPNTTNKSGDESIKGEGGLSTKSTHKCAGVDTSLIDCSDIAANENPVMYLLRKVFNILLYVAGVLAVLSLMVAGTIYATAAQNEDRVRFAKGMIRNTVIGLLAYLFMAVILNFLIPGGVFR